MTDYQETLEGYEHYWSHEPYGDAIREVLAEVERLKAALALYGPPNCDFLHHKSSDRHEGGVECPVVKRIKALKGE